MYEAMENLGAEPHGRFHEVIVPEEYTHYRAFTFTRCPYNRVASAWNMLVNPGDSDIFRMLNHSIYKAEMPDLTFKTFCKWLGTAEKDDYFYDLSISQHKHLEPCNVELQYIKLEDYEDDLNKLCSRIKLKWRNSNENPKSFFELADQECLDLVNAWAEEDFNYGYIKREKI